jgi:DNA-directed RNA polymerase subunit RPC12/RpoP
MNYKFTCPACGSRMSRWQMFSTVSLDYRCRSCGATFRLSAQGWAVCFGVITLQLVCFALTVKQIISPYAAIALLVIICSLALWLLPYLTPVQSSGQPSDKRSTHDTS